MVNMELNSYNGRPHQKAPAKSYTRGIEAE